MPPFWNGTVGRYEVMPGFVTTITLEDGHLYAQNPGRTAVALYPASETEFFLRAVDARVRFLVDESGAVTGAILSQGGVEFEATKVE